VPLDTFYGPNPALAAAIAAGMGILYYFSVTPAQKIQELPVAVQALHRIFPAHWYPTIWKGVAGIHVAESVVALGICLRRGWYGPVNVAKWTISTFLFGFGSMKKLRKHGRQVRRGIKNE
jgi:hypothetical protein